MRTSYIIYGLIIFSAIIIGTSTVINAFHINYPSTINDGTDLGIFAQANQTTAFATKIRSSFTPTQSSGLLDVVGNYIGFAIVTIRLVFESIPIITNIVNSTSTLFSIDAIWVDLFITLIFIGIGFGIWDMITRWKN